MLTPSKHEIMQHRWTTGELFYISLAVITLVFVCADGSTPENLVDMNEFSQYEQYRDIFPLSANNCSSFVFKKKEPWVIVFHDDEHILTGWKTMAASLRGVVWVGVINKKDNDVLNEMELEASVIPPAVVYPYGNAKFKKAHKEIVFTPLEAKNTVVRTIPDRFKKVNADNLSEFFMEGFTAEPSRFPAFLIHSDDVLSPVYKALALRFQKYFHFGKVINPSTADLSAMGLQNQYFEYPTFLTMVTTNPIEPKVNAVFYRPEDMGEVNYPNLMKFLFYINREFRHNLPGDNRSNEQSHVELLDIKHIEEERFKFVTSKGGAVNPKTEL